MSSSKKPDNQIQSQQNVIHYLGIIICGGLSAFGIYEIFTNRLEDGIINIIIGSSLVFSFVPFDYNKAPKWQKTSVIVYGLLLIIGIVYVLFRGFTK